MLKRKWMVAAATVAIIAAGFGATKFWSSSASAEPIQQSGYTTVQPIVVPAATFGPAMEIDRDRGVATLSPLLEKTTPAVVNIAVESKVRASAGPLMQDPFFQHFFDLPERFPEQRRQSAGSGVIVDARNGYILTNHHVIERAENVAVTLKDGRRFDAEIVGSDDATDIALLKIDAKGLSELRIDAVTAVETGDYVIAIGNPFGLGQTVTSGIVSATGRSGLNNERYENFIQTDAPINPGNSGGALVNSKGELIGINTAIIAPGGGNVGIGFAVPTTMAKQIMDQLVEHGEVKRGRIGVSIQSMTPDLAEALDLEKSEGAIVAEVVEGSPSDEAGIEAGDVIYAVDGEAVRTSSDLRNRVGLTPAGESLELSILRDGKDKTVRVKVEPASSSARSVVARLSGAEFTSIPATVSTNTKGVLVASIERGSEAWRSGLRSGDIIRAVNRKPVNNPGDFESDVEQTEGAVALSVERGSARVFVVLR